MSPCATDGAGQGRQTQAGWSTQAHDTAVGPRGPGGALGRVEERARIRAGRQGAEAHLGEVGSAGLGWRGGAVPMAQTPGKEAESGRSGDLSELSEVVKLLWRAEEDRRAEERHPASGRGKGGVLARCHVQIGDTPELGASKGMEAEVGDTPSTIRVY